MRKIFSLLMAVLCCTGLFANSYWYRGGDNSWGATAMTVSTDGLYEYIQSSSNANQFKIAASADSWDYNHSNVQAGFNSTDVTNIGDYGQDNCYCWQSGSYYILVYYPNTAVNTTANPIICAASTLPDNSSAAQEDGDAIVLTFTYYNSTSGDGSAKLSTVEGIFDVASQAYVSAVNVGTQVYAGRKYKDGNDSIFSNLKFGSSTAVGELKFTLKNEVEVDSIVFRAAMYANNEGGDGFKVNDDNFTLSAGKLIFEDKVWKPTGKVSSIDIIQNKASKGRFFLTSITIYPKSAGSGDTPEPPTPAAPDSIFFVNVPGWDNLRVHLWDGTAAGTTWPGVEMTKLGDDDKINGYEVYKYVAVEGAYAKCVFSNNGADEGKSADLDWTSGKYFYDGAWYAKDEIPALPTAAYHIAGAWTGWKLVELAVAADEKTATYEIEFAPADYEFKIVRTFGTDTTWYTKQNEGAFGLHREYTGVAGVTDQANNNLKVTADEGGKYVFTWTFANDSIGIAFPAKHVLSETWGVDENTEVAAETKYVDNYAVAIETVYATTLKENARKFGSYAFTHAIQIRNAAYPSADAPQGTEQSGSTSLVITAKENVDITLFYNRQTTDNTTGAAASNDGKDMKVFDQAAPTTALEAEFRVVSMQEDKKYVNAIKTVSLVKGHTYTVSAKGTTIQLSGIRYATNAEAPVAKYYIIGAGEAFGEWSHVAVYEDSYEIKDLAAGNYMFRLTMAEDDWSKDYGFAQLTVKPEGVTGNDDNNICFELRQASDFKVTYKPAAGDVEAVFTVEANFYVPVKNDLYLVPNQWADGDAKIAAWTWNKDKSIQVFTEFFAPKAEDNDTLVAKVLAEADSIIFVRFNKDATEPKWNGGEGYQWNQTPDDSIQWDKAIFTILPGEGYTTNGTWDVYTPEPPATFYITGNAALVGEDLKWNAQAVKATANTYTFVGLHANTEYLLKVIEDGNWDGGKVYGYSNLSDQPEGLSADHDDNIVFQLAEDGDVTVTYYWEEVVENVWGMTFKVEGNFYVAPKANLYLVPNQWAEDDAKIAAWTWSKDGSINAFTEFFAPKAEGNDTLVAEVLADADSIIFVRFNKDATEPKWNGGEDYQWNQTPDDSIRWDKAIFTILPGEGYTTNGTWDVYTPAQPRLADGFYLIGQKGWAVDSLNADLLFTANPDNAGEYQLTVNLVANQSIKVVSVANDAIVAWYPDGQDNDYTIDLAHEGLKTIYFKPEGDQAWSDFGGYFYIEPNQGTGVENGLSDQVQSNKVVRNGQLFIIRDGKTYTVQGAEVK